MDVDVDDENGNLFCYARFLDWLGWLFVGLGVSCFVVLSCDACRVWGVRG